jgi:hypothetical protein
MPFTIGEATVALLKTTVGADDNKEDADTTTTGLVSHHNVKVPPNKHNNTPM